MDWIESNDKFECVFGIYSYWSVGTLLDALNTTDNPYDWYGNGIKALQRGAVAALLNASNPNVNFKYSVDDIIWKVRTAYATGMYQLYADCLHIENNRGGDITTGNQIPDRVEEIRLELTKQIFVRNIAPTLVIFITIVQQVDKDRWTNIKLSQPKPGQFFNRRSCSWYWHSKRKDATLLQGLVAFAKEDYETTEKHWNLLAELDKEFYAQQKVSGWENATTLARLTWNLRNQKGSLYATPEEMTSFKDPKRRMAILIADLYYESEQHQKALSVYQRLENRELGTLSKNELAYVMFATFACLSWDTKMNEIKYIEPRAKQFNGTPSESRAILGYTNRICVEGTPKELFKALKCYTLLSKHSSIISDKETASFMIGKIYEYLAENATYLQNSVLALEYCRKAIEYYQELLKTKKLNLIVKRLNRI